MLVLRSCSTKGFLMRIVTVEGSCWQIHLLAELALLAGSACRTLLVHCVTVISHSIIIMLLYREMVDG
jgi:hypothetical protein